MVWEKGIESNPGRGRAEYREFLRDGREASVQNLCVWEGLAEPNRQARNAMLCCRGSGHETQLTGERRRWWWCVCVCACAVKCAGVCAGRCGRCGVAGSAVRSEPGPRR